MEFKSILWLTLVVFFMFGMSIVGAFILTVLLSIANGLIEAYFGGDPPTFPPDPCL